MGFARVLLRAMGLVALVGCAYLAGSTYLSTTPPVPSPPLTPLIPPPELALAPADAAGPVPTPEAAAPPSRRPAGVAIPTVPARPTATQVPQVPQAPEQAGWRGSQQMNLLLVGLDRRPEETLGRTDTIVLARVDLATHSAGVLSIPRDLVVDIPGFGRDRINTAYVYGELYGKAGGMDTLKATVLRNFGVPIDHYAMVDFGCFRGLVDALGGVTVDIPKHIVDTQYPTDDYGTMRVEFLPGVQVLDGERALEYARTRHADNDFNRMRRQQQLVLALRAQILRPQAVAAVPSIVRSCWGTTSDLSFGDMVSLGTAARDIDGRKIVTATVDESITQPFRTRAGADVLLPDWPAIRARVAQVFPMVAARATTN